mmetsp:Transcript_16288/g.35367  ORF Transcript_16288/g.35367 Transcript_16288/m.35367 type:complete len:202 (+) Transcript_16288:292-897(+)
MRLFDLQTLWLLPPRPQGNQGIPGGVLEGAKGPPQDERSGRCLVGFDLRGRRYFLRVEGIHLEEHQRLWQQNGRHQCTVGTQAIGTVQGLVGLRVGIVCSDGVVEELTRLVSCRVEWSETEWNAMRCECECDAMRYNSKQVDDTVRYSKQTNKIYGTRSSIRGASTKVVRSYSKTQKRWFRYEQFRSYNNSKAKLSNHNNS